MQVKYNWYKITFLIIILTIIANKHCLMFIRHNNATITSKSKNFINFHKIEQL